MVINTYASIKIWIIFLRSIWNNTWKNIQTTKMIVWNALHCVLSDTEWHQMYHEQRCNRARTFHRLQRSRHQRSYRISQSFYHLVILSFHHFIVNLVRPIITSILLLYVRIWIINTIFSQKKIKINLTLKIFGLAIIIVGSLFGYKYLLGFFWQETLAITNTITTKSLLLFVVYCTAFVGIITVFFFLRHKKNMKASESFYDVEKIPTPLDTSNLNEMQKLEISKAVRYKNRYKSILKIVLIWSLFFIAIAYWGFLIWINVLIIYYLVSAYAEEYLKYSTGNNVFLASKENNTSNIIFFCILIGLWFSAVENIFYIINNVLNQESVNIINLLMGRGLVSTLIHIVSTGLIAFIIIRTKKTNNTIIPIILGILGWFWLHSVYNISLQYNLSYVTIPMIILAFFLLTYLTFQSDIIYSSEKK